MGKNSNGKGTRLQPTKPDRSDGQLGHIYWSDTCRVHYCQPATLRVPRGEFLADNCNGEEQSNKSIELRVKEKIERNSNTWQ